MSRGKKVMRWRWVCKIVQDEYVRKSERRLIESDGVR